MLPGMILPQIWLVLFGATALLMMPSELVNGRPRHRGAFSGLLAGHGLMFAVLLAGGFESDFAKGVVGIPLETLFFRWPVFWCTAPFLATAGWFAREALRKEPITHRAAVCVTGVLGLIAGLCFILAENAPRGGFMPGMERLGYDIGAVLCAMSAGLIVFIRLVCAWLTRPAVRTAATPVLTTPTISPARLRAVPSDRQATGPLRMPAPRPRCSCSSELCSEAAAARRA